MKKVYVNETWCLGCHLCEYHCAYAETNEPDMALALRDKKISPRIRIEQQGDISFAVSCRHCDEPLCVKSCISGALTRVDGAIRIDTDVCIGCYTCVLVCPYGCISTSERGAVQKCELCLQTRTGMPGSDAQPRCVAHCPNGAIVYEER